MKTVRCLQTKCVTSRYLFPLILKTTRSDPTKLAVGYFARTLDGVAQSSFLACLYQASRGSLASGCRA